MPTVDVYVHFRGRELSDGHRRLLANAGLPALREFPSPETNEVAALVRVEAPDGESAVRNVREVLEPRLTGLEWRVDDWTLGPPPES